MRLIKRLHIFVLKSFLPLFAMTFFIVLFIVLMQFLWKYIDDLVGKGLEMKVLAELFFYAAVSLVPTALPLAILLASLMTFGNLGEKFELTAMKAAGVSLLRTMAPLIVFIGGVSVGAFFFQNEVLPRAQVKMWTLLFSMKQKSPELEIPEGVFYDQIPGFNLYVKHKDKDRAILHGLMIYDVRGGYEKSTVLVADSAKLAFTKGMKNLYLHLWRGEQFDNLSDQNTASQNVPFRRELFDEKEILIPFDANFNRLDEGGMRKQYVGKNIAELRHTIDSVQARVDSVGDVYSRYLRLRDYGGVRAEVDPETRKPKPYKAVAMPAVVPNIDTLMSALQPAKRSMIYAQAIRKAEAEQADCQFKAETMEDDRYSVRRHEIELMKKFTLSVACLIFFFIGAPLGAIIRKGGLGTPLVISVFLFIVYYIIDNTGYKMARDGHWVVWQGMWISTFVLTPLGIYVTWQAMNDSAVFNPDAYRNLLARMLGVRQSRKVEFKEVIINDISPARAEADVTGALDAAKALLAICPRPQLYFSYWLKGFPSLAIHDFGQRLDGLCEYLSDSRDKAVVNKLLDLPVTGSLWIYRPATRRWMGYAGMILFPIGIPLWLFGMYKQHSLIGELKTSETVLTAILGLLRKDQDMGNNPSGDPQPEVTDGPTA